MEGMVEVLREWLANNDRDSRKRERHVGSGSGSGTVKKTTSVGALDCLENTVWKRQHVKQSIDHVLNLLKGYCPTPTAQFVFPLGKYTLYPTPASRPDINTNNELSSRWPSLLHIYDDLPVPSPSSSHRPRSAAQDSELEPLHIPSIPYKLGSKYLL